MKKLALALVLTLAACVAPADEAGGTAGQTPQAIAYSGSDINANTQITSSTADVLYTDVSGGSITLSSKTSGPGTPAVGMTIILRDMGSASGTNKVIFAPGGTWTIDGSASKDLITSANKTRWIRLKTAAGAWTTLGGEL